MTESSLKRTGWSSRFVCREETVVLKKKDYGFLLLIKKLMINDKKLLTIIFPCYIMQLTINIKCLMKSKLMSEMKSEEKL